jgi:hypothetical protein
MFAFGEVLKTGRAIILDPSLSVVLRRDGSGSLAQVENGQTDCGTRQMSRLESGLRVESNAKREMDKTKSTIQHVAKLVGRL